MTTPDTSIGYLDADYVAERTRFFLPRSNRPVWLACGDEGELTDASHRELAAADSEVATPDEGTVAAFGQVAGLTLTTLAVGEAVHGPEFFDSVGGFRGLMQHMVAFMRDDKGRFAVRPAGHSDRPKETAAYAAEGEAPPIPTFSRNGKWPVGCAYATNVGALAWLAHGNSLVQDVATDNLRRIFENGDSAPELFDAYGRVATRLGPEFTVGRAQFAELDLAVMALKRTGTGDTHVPASKTGLLLNLNPLSSSLVHDGYRADVGASVKIIRQAIGKERDLPSQLLMSAFVVDATAVRTLLAAHDATGDHTPDPRRIAIGVVGGTAAESLDTIARIEHQD